MQRRRFATALPALLLAAVLLLGTSGPPAPPALAEHEPGHESVARLEVEVKSVYVLNDQDWFSSGDLYFIAYLVSCAGAYDDRPRCWNYELIPVYDFSGGIQKFSADSGETVALNRVFPGPGDPGDIVDGARVSERVGIPVYPGRAYRLVFLVNEEDSVATDMIQCFIPWCGDTDIYFPGDRVQGVSWLDLDEENGWGVGGHTGASSKTCSRVVSLFPPSTEVGPCFEFSYEVRHTPLPDLHPRALRVDNPPGAKQPNLCATVENLGQRAADPFRLLFYADDSPAGDIGMGGLAAGQSDEQCAQVCVQVNPLDYGRHALSVTVDAPRAVPEMDESNNVLTRDYIHRATDDTVAPLGPAGLAPDAAPGTGQPRLDPGAVGPEAGRNLSEPGDDRVLVAPAPSADLLVSAIRVRGEDAHGTNDCDPGKNDITVVVKNQGSGPAAGFVVRVVVDGEDDEAKEKSGLTLDGGKELAVTFDDLRLGKGEHKLTATADAKKAVAESNEDNNELKVSAQCRDEG